MKRRKKGVLQTDSVGGKTKAADGTPTPGQLGKAAGTEDAYVTWGKRVKLAIKVREAWEKDFEVEECENYIIGRQYGAARGRGPMVARGDQIILNHVLATIKTVLPNLIYQAPKFFGRPVAGQVSPAGEDDARIAESVLETIAAKHQNLKKAARLALMQNFPRIAVLKVCYDPDLVPNPSAGEPIYSTDAQGAALKDDFGNPIQMKNPLTGEALIEPEKILRADLYRWEWVDSRRMLLPDEGPDMAKWTWLGEEVIVPLAEAKDDDRFPQTFRDQFQSNITDMSASDSRPTRTKPDRDHDPLFRYYEVYDLKNKTQVMWADGQEFHEFLLNRPLPPGILDHPYALLLGWTPIQGPDPLPWPYPYIKDWLGIAREININSGQQMEGAKRSARKFVYDDSTFANETEAAKALQNPLDMVGAKVNNVDKPPVVVAAPDINPAIYKTSAMLLMTWRIITGQTGAKLGAPDADTATEASFVEHAANLRDSDLQDSINDWLTVAGQKMYHLVRKTLTLKIWVKLRGFSDEEFEKYLLEEYHVDPAILQQIPGAKAALMREFGEETWKPITQEDLDFDCEITVVPGSSRPRNIDVERRAFTGLLGLLGQFPQLMMSKELLKTVAEMFDFRNARMIDELNQLALKMVQVNATQAGRTQGGSPQQPGGLPEANAALSGITGGMP